MKRDRDKQDGNDSGKQRFFHRLTFKLTLLHLTLFTAASLIIFILIYFSLAAALKTRVDEELKDGVREFEAVFKSRGLEKLQKEFINESSSNGSGAWFYLLLSPDHRILASSNLGPWRKVDLIPSFIDSLQAGEEALRTYPRPGNEHKIRIIYKKMRGGFILEIGKFLRDNDEILENVGSIFGYGFLSMLSIGALLGWLISRQAMLGVERVTETAVHIDRGDLSSRVPIGKEGKEIEDLARAFNGMLDRIQILIEDLERVTSDIAHDLRSPLTRIRGMAENILTDPEDSHAFREMAGMIIEECDRLVGLINTMLEIGQADSGLSRLSKTSFDIRTLIQEITDFFQPAAEDKGFTINVISPEEPLIVSGDKTALGRVLANLLDNAIKFSEEEGTIKVASRNEKANIVIEISDNGIGIKEKDLPHIFERFYRGDTSRSAPGNGLGLSLVLSIVRAHGGTIEVASTPGKGSTFIIYLRDPSSRPL